MKPRRSHAVRATIAMLALAAGSWPAARAARGQDGEPPHTYFCQVSQPMVARDDRRVEIHPVTYALKLPGPVPGIEIQYTSRPGPVVVPSTHYLDSLGAAEIVNLNAASLMGIEVWVENRPQGTWNATPDTSAATRAGGKPRQRFFIEELRVDLGLAQMAKRRVGSAQPRVDREELARFDALVEATVACILDNATRSTPPIRKVRLVVTGWDRYRHWADTYPVKTDTERKRFRY